MNHVRSFVIAVLAAAALMLVPRAADAQQAITTDLEGGIAVPAGDLSDAIDPGPAFTLGFNFQVHDRVSIRLEGGTDLYKVTDVADLTVDGETEPGPDVTLTRLGAGLVFHAVSAEQTGGVWVDVDAGGGYYILTTDSYEIDTPSDVETLDVAQGYLGAKGGLTVGYQFHDAVSAFVGGDAYLVPGDADDLEAFTELAEVDDGAESHVSFPVQAGLRLHFQP